MAPQARHRVLAEGLADWEAMAHDRSGTQVLLRALRGVPAFLWTRLSDRSVTSLPAGVALALVGFGGMAAGSRSSAYPEPFRFFVLASSAGLLLLGLGFVRDPQRLIIRRYRCGSLLTAIGFMGLAFTLPTAAQWPYDGPVLEHVVMDRAMQASFVIIAVALLMLTLASFLSAPQRLVRLAGIALMAGVIVLGLTQLSWGIGMSPVDLAMTVASVTIGLGALSFAHVLPRLRHLPVETQSEPQDELKGTA
jgi:hypothetical protein